MLEVSVEQTLLSEFILRSVSGRVTEIQNDIMLVFIFKQK